MIKVLFLAHKTSIGKHYHCMFELFIYLFLISVKLWSKIYLLPGLNRKIVYSLVDSADGMFSTDPSSGVVILEKSLDREVQDTYQIRIKATDRAGADGSLSTEVDLTIVVLDVNDNPPVFQKQDYAVTVPEDVTVGTEVLRVFATTADIGVNAEIYYRFLSGNELGKFSIDDSTGKAEMHIFFVLWFLVRAYL